MATQTVLGILRWVLDVEVGVHLHLHLPLRPMPPKRQQRPIDPSIQQQQLPSPYNTPNPSSQPAFSHHPGTQDPPDVYSQPVPPEHIQQPSHSTGIPYQGPKINPAFVPSPVTVRQVDQDYWKEVDEGFVSGAGMGMPPLSTTDVPALDHGSFPPPSILFLFFSFGVEMDLSCFLGGLFLFWLGNSTPAHLRLTTYSIPATSDLAQTSHVPLGVVVQPFARILPGEHPVPLATFGGRGPGRCKVCRGYINVWCRWVQNGEKWICNLCEGVNEGEPSPVAFCLGFLGRLGLILALFLGISLPGRLL